MLSARAHAACLRSQSAAAGRTSLKAGAVWLRVHAVSTSHSLPTPPSTTHEPLRPCVLASLPSRRPGSMACRAGDGQESTTAPDPPVPGPPGDEGSQDGPTFMEGVNFYCYVVLGLLFVTDLTPVGECIH
jgi:hypothetical protein